MDDLLETAPCGFLSLDDDARIVHTNATLSSWLERAPGALVGEHVDSVFSVGARVYYQTHLFPLLKLQGEVHEIYLSLQTARGADLPVLVNAARVERSGEYRNELIVVVIRRRSRFEDEILQAKKAALEANRAKGRFLSMISHDLRSPLSTIVMTTEILASGASGPVTEAQKRDLHVIKQSGDYVLGLIKDMLHFSRLEAGRLDLRLQALSLDEVLIRAESLVRHQMDSAGLSYRREPAPGLHVRADPDRLQQILLNLLTNAAKFTDAGGHVTVTSERRRDRVLVHVEDDGMGIPADQVEAIFSPFVQAHDPSTERSRSGVGLGLSISRELARAMGGDVTVTSAPGRGSVFSVVLPASGSDVSGPNRTDEQDPPFPPPPP